MTFRGPLAVAAAALVLSPAALGSQHHAPAPGPDGYVCGAPPPLTETNVPLWEGVAGTVKDLPRVSDNLTAQRYFEQGVALIYGFNHLESVLSFRKAASLDPGCAMCFWGVAVALGPNINEPINQQRWEMAAAHADSAWARRRPGKPVEEMYLQAARARYLPLPRFPLSPDEFRRIRGEMDSRYAESMWKIWYGSRYTDLTAGTIYTEALMDLHPWDLWTRDGKPKWNVTSEALNTTREVLRRKPDHVGAAHLWIHLLEGSHRPDSAVAQADLLQRLMPGAAHIVHMPSHIYHRVGRYETGVRHNVQATQIDSAYLAFRGWMWRYPMYYAHDNDFLWVSGTFAGMRDDAVRSADALNAIVGPQLIACYSNAQHFLTAPILVAVRFGEWDRALAVPQPAPQYRYPVGMWHFGQGWAQLRKNNTAAAEQHARMVFSIAESISPDSMISNNQARALLTIAGRMLAGEILASRGQYDAAIDSLRGAVQMQDSLNYDEPPPFFFPARHSLGAVLLESRDPENVAIAELVYLTDLGFRDADQYPVKRNPDNGWAYRGMVNTMRAMGADTTRWANDFQRVWKGRQVPPGSRY